MSNLKHYRVYIIATEMSSDALGGQLLSQLEESKHILGCTIEIKGIGGFHMESYDSFRSLFSIEELSLMGISEIIPKIWHIKKRITEVVDDILEFSPDLLLTIDCPSFSLRVINKLKTRLKKQGKIPFPKIHYVAPSVWAWRSKRALKWAKHIDHMMCLFPFEPPYFSKHNLPASFIGHPILEQDACNIQKESLFLILPGSRKSEIKYHLPLFLDVYTQLKKDYEEFHSFKVVIPTYPHLVPLIKKYAEAHKEKCNIEIEANPSNRFDLYKKAKLAIAVSGTVSLELFYFKVSTIIAYKTSKLNYFIAKKLVKTAFISLPNIILNKSIIKELIQDECAIDELTQSLYAALKQPINQEDYTMLFNELLLKKDNISPSVKALSVILSYLKN
jgi:lipid-A-disaccharide synthase